MPSERLRAFIVFPSSRRSRPCRCSGCRACGRLESKGAQRPDRGNSRQNAWRRAPVFGRRGDASRGGRPAGARLGGDRDPQQEKRSRRRHLHRGPQHQLHQRLHLPLPVLRVLPALLEGPRRLRSHVRPDRRKDPRDDRPRRNGRAAAGRRARRAALLLLRGDVPVHSEELSVDPSARALGPKSTFSRR